MVDFSHIYKKMPKAWKNSQLLQALLIDTQDLSNDMIIYDTETIEGQYYHLPAGPAIMLIMRCENTKELWTTIRSFSHPKFDWYKSLEGYFLPFRLIEPTRKLQDTPCSFSKEQSDKQQQQTFSEQQAAINEIDNARTNAALEAATRWKYPPAGLPTRKPGQ